MKLYKSHIRELFFLEGILKDEIGIPTTVRTNDNNVDIDYYEYQISRKKSLSFCLAQIFNCVNSNSRKIIIAKKTALIF